MPFPALPDSSLLMTLRPPGQLGDGSDGTTQSVDTDILNGVTFSSTHVVGARCTAHGTNQLTRSSGSFITDGIRPGDAVTGGSPVPPGGMIVALVNSATLLTLSGTLAAGTEPQVRTFARPDYYQVAPVAAPIAPTAPNIGLVHYLVLRSRVRFINPLSEPNGTAAAVVSERAFVSSGLTSIYVPTESFSESALGWSVSEPFVNTPDGQPWTFDRVNLISGLGVDCRVQNDQLPFGPYVGRLTVADFELEVWGIPLAQIADDTDTVTLAARHRAVVASAPQYDRVAMDARHLSAKAFTRQYDSVGAAARHLTTALTPLVETAPDEASLAARHLSTALALQGTPSAVVSARHQSSQAVVLATPVLSLAAGPPTLKLRARLEP